MYSGEHEKVLWYFLLNHSDYFPSDYEESDYQISSFDLLNVNPRYTQKKDTFFFFV